MIFDIHHFETLASTSATAREWVDQGAPEGVVIVARRQSAGRGRQGRTWSSLPGALLFSLILRPRWEPQDLPRLGFYACLAGIATAAMQGVSTAMIKWPNDLVLPRPTSWPPWSKWGGILLESGIHDGRPWLILGVGLNIGPLDSAAGLREELGCASLSDILHRAITPEEALPSWLEEFASLYTGDQSRMWPEALDRWRERDILYGRRVQASSGQGLVEGIAEGVDDRGTLTLRSPSGRVSIEAGDVHLTVPGQE